MPFTIKQHDQRPYLEGQILQPDGTEMDLSLATEGWAIMRKKGEIIPIFRKEITFTDKAMGEFEYRWEVGDTDVVGEYDFEVEIIWGTEPQTFPVDSYYPVIIVDDLDAPGP